MWLPDGQARCKRSREHTACQEQDRPANAKRRKTASINYPPEVWDALSKITLTRKALRELVRRTEEDKHTRVAIVKSKTRRLLRSDTRRLIQLAKDGGLDMSNLRGYASASSISKSSSRRGKRTRDSGLPSEQAATRTSTTGPYDPQFEQLLVDQGVYPKNYRMQDGSRAPLPNNIADIRERLSRPRPSLSPSAFSNTAFEDFQDWNDQAQSETAAIAHAIPIITGARDRHCATVENKQFNNLEQLGPNLRVPVPDKYYGARPEQIDPAVRWDLSQYIVPSTNTRLPAAPNFFFEGKSAAGRPDVAQRQVMNDNAYGARGMFHLQNFGRATPVYDNNAYTIGSSYSDGQLKVYATHPQQSTAGGTDYYMTQIDTYAMTGNIDSFRCGAAAFRNSRDFTDEHRTRFIASANAASTSFSTAVTSARTGTSFAMASCSFGSDTSTEELNASVVVRGSSDESGGNVRPRKRGTRTRNTPRLGSNTQTSASSVQISSTGTQKTREKARDTTNDNDSDDDYVTANGEDD